MKTGQRPTAAVPAQTFARRRSIVAVRISHRGGLMQDRDKIYIDGAWVPSSGSGRIDVINSTTEEVMGRIPDGTPEDVDRAVAAAKTAFPSWSATSREERGKFLQRITERLQARMMDIPNTRAGGGGVPINLSII